MSPTPTPPPNEEDCVFCHMGNPAEQVKQLRQLITARTPHVICAGCRRSMGEEVTRQLNRMAEAPSRKWD
jgi:hypothetical protein